MKNKEILTRKHAKERGLARYYTGKPCPRGHYAERKTDSSTCTECECFYDRKYKDSKKGQQYRIKYQSRIRGTEKAKTWARKTHLKRNYGMTLEEFDSMINDQKNNCKICNDSFENTQPYVDHCHTTGNIRGILCKSCNQMLGFSKDNIIILKEAIDYLK